MKHFELLTRCDIILLVRHHLGYQNETPTLNLEGMLHQDNNDMNFAEI